METTSARELIIASKNAIKAQNLTFNDVKALLATEGVYPGDTTLRRFMKEGSEDNDSFNFEGTLRPIFRVLVENHPATDETTQTLLDLYKEVCLYKHEKIEQQEETIRSLRKQIEHMKEEQSSKCRKCEENTEILKNQLTVKDRRMDEQKERTDRLLDRIEQLTDVLMERGMT